MNQTHTQNDHHRSTAGYLSIDRAITAGLLDNTLIAHHTCCGHVSLCPRSLLWQMSS